MRTILLAFAVLAIIACEDPFTTGGPAVSPGIVVPGLSQLCPFGNRCGAWSADSKTFYVVANYPTPSTAALVAVDVATLTVRAVGGIHSATFDLQPSADGSAIYIAAQDPQSLDDVIIERMSLADGSTTTVARTNNPDFVLSPDGAALAYHAIDTTLATDTVVVVDVASGTRRATTVERFCNLAAFSADGTLLGIMPGNAVAIHIWHLASGVRDTIPARHVGTGLYEVAWSGGAFRMLFVAFSGQNAFIDTSVAGGSARTYTVDRDPSQIIWLPDRSALWAIPASPICGPEDCLSFRYDFIYATEGNDVTVGAATSRGFPAMNASPDGRWIAHTEDFGPLYLLHRPTP